MNVRPSLRFPVLVVPLLLASAIHIASAQAPPDCNCCCEGLLNGGVPTACLECDTNSDGEITVTDLVRLGCPLDCVGGAPPTPTPVPVDCACCCDALLSGEPPVECPACDANQNGFVSVTDLVRLKCPLRSCFARPTPTPTPEPSHCDCCCDVFLGERPLSDCPDCDANRDGQVRVLDLMRTSCFFESSARGVRPRCRSR